MATPIAVAVREALFTSSGLNNSTCRGVQSSLWCTAPFCSTSLGSDSSYLVSLCAMYWMRLLRLAHSIWDHSVVVLCFSGLCLRASGRGEPGFRGGPCLVLLFLCWLLVIQDLNLMFRLTVSPAKRASPKFMKMVSFGSSHSLWLTRSHGPQGSYRGKKKVEVWLPFSKGFRRMKLCVSRFDCLVQKVLGTWNCVCLEWLHCSKGFRYMKLCVPRFGCIVQKVLGT